MGVHNADTVFKYKDKDFYICSLFDMGGYVHDLVQPVHDLDRDRFFARICYLSDGEVIITIDVQPCRSNDDRL